MAIQQLLRLSLLSLLLTVAFQTVRADDSDSDEEYADDTRAHLLVRKYTKDDIVVQGRNVTIYIDIYNAGVSTASNVKYVDSLPPNSTLVEGSLDAKFQKLSVGSHLKHNYTVVFNSGNLGIELPVATVTYKPDSESNEIQNGISTGQQLFVMTPVQQIQRYALKAGVYASLGFARSPSDWRNLAILIGTVSTLLGVNWAVKKIGVVNVNKRREKALKYLEKNN